MLSSILDSHQSRTLPPLTLPCLLHSPLPFCTDFGWSTGNFFPPSVLISAPHSLLPPLHLSLPFAAFSQKRRASKTTGLHARGSLLKQPTCYPLPTSTSYRHYSSATTPAPPHPQPSLPKLACNTPTHTLLYSPPTRSPISRRCPTLAAHTVNNKLSTGLKCASHLMWPMEQNPGCAARLHSQWGAGQGVCVCQRKLGWVANLLPLLATVLHGEHHVLFEIIC